MGQSEVNKGGSSHEYLPLRNRRDSVQKERVQHYLRIVAFRLVPVSLIFLVGLLIGYRHSQFLHIYARRPHTYHLNLLPSRLPPVPSSLSPPYPNLPPAADPIPNIVHYVYGLAPPSNPREEFPYYAYLGMRSAVMSLDPEAVWFHCIHEPVGYWWDEVNSLQGMDGRPIIHVKKVRDVTHVGTKQNPVEHFAHKADVLRLEILDQHGGIYLDIDTFILRSFSSHGLLMQNTVLAMEASPQKILRGLNGDDEMDPKGLCNAIIVSRPGARFVKTWLEAYEEFDASKWADHSVHLPWVLAQVYPTEVTVLSERAFFWPTWTDDHLHAVYEEDEYSFDDSGQLAYHLWESKRRTYLGALNPLTIDEIDTSFTRMARRFQAGSEKARWMRHLENESLATKSGTTTLGVTGTAVGAGIGMGSGTGHVTAGLGEKYRLGERGIPWRLVE